MPTWLKVISHLNPLTYVVDALRTAMLAGSPSSFGMGVGYTVVLVTTIILVLIGGFFIRNWVCRTNSGLATVCQQKS